ncbi:MAG: hypothetical protein QOI42_2184 [Frankiaceae bacterium]|nr:hypothetical protein [Frankiaceae bacterium]
MSDRRSAGSATVLTLAVVAVLMTGLVVACQLGAVAVARHRAAAAADLAAVAAAATWPLATRGACDRASETAAANGARLIDCSTAGAAAQVTVAVSVRLLRVGGGSVIATARAARDGGSPPTALSAARGPPCSARRS